MKLIVQERGRLVTYELDGDEVTIGSDPDCAVAVRDPEAGPVHIRLRRHRGVWYAETCPGLPHARYNGKRLARARLWPGDELGIGTARIWFERRPEARESASDEPEVGSTTLVQERAAPAPAVIPPEDDDDELAGLLDDEAPGGGAAGETSRFALEIVGGPLAGRRVPIARVPFAVGRTRDNDLRLPDVEVSSHHCRFEQRPGGGLVLVDLESTNGTRVNHRRVARAVIADGAQIEIGRNVLVFRDREAEHPGAGAPRTAPRARSKARDRVPPPGREIIGPAGEHSREPASSAGAERSLEAATATLARHAAREAAELPAGSGGGRAPAVAAVAFVVLLAVGLALLVRSGIGSSQPEALDPPVPGVVDNGSFERGEPGGVPPGWAVVPGLPAAVRLGPPAVGGARSLRLAPRGAALAAVRSTAPLACGGREVEVRAWVRAATTDEVPAAIGLRWSSSRGEVLAWSVLSAVTARAGRWRAVRALVLPPPGVDRAEALLLAAGPVYWDRVVLVERGLPAPRRRAVRAGAFVARIDDSGAVAIDRDERPAIDRLRFVLLPETEARPEPLGWTATPRARTEPAAAKDAGEEQAARAATPTAVRGWWLEGRALARAVSGAAEPLGWSAAIAAEPEGTLALRWELSGAAPGTRAGLVFTASRRAIAERLERTGRGPVCSEIVLGRGADSVTLSFDPPLEVRERRGKGALGGLLLAPAGARGFTVRVGRSSQRDRERDEAAAAEAQALETAGKLEAARRRWLALARDADEPSVRRRALERAERTLAEIAALEDDARRFGQRRLVVIARRRCDELAQTYPGTRWAQQAQQARKRLEALEGEIARLGREREARALLAEAERHLAARRFRIARALVGEFDRRFAAIESLELRARELRELADRGIEVRRQGGQRR